MASIAFTSVEAPKSRFSVRATTIYCLTVGVLAGVGLGFGQITLGVLLMPLAWVLAPSRAVWVLANVLFLSFAAGDTGAAYQVATEAKGAWEGAWAHGVPIAWACGQALPGVLAWRWRDHPNWKVRLAVAVLVWVVAPVVFAPWWLLHPIVAAGDLFPGSGLMGLALVLGITLGMALLPVATNLRLLVLVAVASSGWSIGHKLADPPALVVTTSNGANLKDANQRVEQLLALQSATQTIAEAAAPGTLIVLPEAALEDVDGSAHAGARMLGGVARKHQVKIWVGVTTQNKDGRDNELLEVTTGEKLTARNPMPSMYPASTFARRYSPSGTVITSPNGKRVSVMFCYEAVALASWLRLVVDRPDGVVWISNQAWRPTGQLASSLNGVGAATGRLFGHWPLSAVNR